MQEAISIKIIDDTQPTVDRRNDLLDEAMGMPSNPEPIRPDYPTPISSPADTKVGKKTEADTGPIDASKPKPLTANFPNTVIGPDGKVYTLEAFEAARRRMEREKLNADANAAYEAMKPKQPKPPPLPGENWEIPNQRKGPPPTPQERTKSAAEGQAQMMMDPYGLKGSADLIAGGAMKMGPMAAAGAVLPLVAAAADQTAKSLRNMKANVDMVGDSLVTFAGNERAGLSQLAEGAGKAFAAPAESLPIIGDVFKAQNELTSAITKLPEKLTSAFLQQAQKISAYSGDISAANARANVREIVADIREAQSMGESYARMVDAQSRLDNTVRELLMPVKRFLVEVLASRLEFMADGLNVVVKLPEIFKEISESVAQAVTLLILRDTQEANRTLSLMRQSIDRILRRSEEPAGDFFDQFFNDAGRVDFGANAFAG